MISRINFQKWISVFVFIFLLIDSKAINSFPNNLLHEFNYPIKEGDRVNDFYYNKLLRINSNSTISLDYNKKVCLYIDAYLLKHKEKTRGILGRSKVYFPIFEEYLEIYKLPEQLKYIAVIESALEIRATSKSGARGLWQFMYSTGRMLNLKINKYVDERYDTEKSTDAACRYLAYLYSIFGEWQLVLAAYNCGPTAVQLAIDRAGGSTSFWDIAEYLPEQTRNYLPAFIAVNFVFEYYADYGIDPNTDNLTYKFQSQAVVVNKELSLKYIAKCLEIDYDLLKNINPIYEQYYIPKTEIPAVINIPIYKVNDFVKYKSLLFSSKIYND